MKEKDLNENNQTNLKCIKDKCGFYFSSDDYFHTCLLVSKYIIPEKCYGIYAIPNKIEVIGCKIGKLLEELECLNELKELVKNNQK